jgi:cytochrome c-type biogenesis protein CcmE
MTRKQKRLAIIAGLGAVLAVATTLILFALRDQIVFFYSPTEMREKAVAVGTPIRLGGLVKEGSWIKTGETNDFVVTDGESEMAVHTSASCPTCSRNRQGVVAEGAERRMGRLPPPTCWPSTTRTTCPRKSSRR